MTSISLHELPPAAAARLLDGRPVAVKQGRRTVARLEPAPARSRAASPAKTITAEEWIKQYATGSRTPGAVAAFLHDRE